MVLTISLILAFFFFGSIYLLHLLRVLLNGVKKGFITKYDLNELPKMDSKEFDKKYYIIPIYPGFYFKKEDLINYFLKKINKQL